MKEKPIIVLLDDDRAMRRELAWILEDFHSDTGGQIQTEVFEDDASAAEFVANNAKNIIGYFQDINRLSSGGLVGTGIRFYNLVINQFTPLAKTVFHSGVLYRAGEDFELPVVEPDKIRLLEKPASWEEIIDNLKWLVSPSLKLSSNLIELLSPPWEEVCRYLAEHPQYLHKINPRKFEMLVAEIFRSFGWDVDLTAQTRDGGYDIVALKRVFPTNLRVLIEAKRWSPDNPVGVQIVRSLYGLRASQSFSKVILATSTYVSGTAKKEFERVIPWELDFMERDAILSWCKAYSNVAIRGEYKNG